VTRRITLGAFVAAGLAVALALVFLVGPEASRAPDGLDKVAADHGLAAHEQPHALDDLPTAGYGVRGVHDRRLSTGLAGALGVTVTFAVTGGVFVLVRRRGQARAASAEPAPG
jgi:cobalt/nickel transport system permease protein